MLEGRHLSFRYSRKRPWLFQDLDVSVAPGQRLGIPGPSGVGKSTLARLLGGYLLPTEGQVMLDGAPLPKRGRSPVQMLFQHPELAVNPRWKIKTILAEAGTPSPELLRTVSIDPSWLERHPHELSGGELQRVCLVRALGPLTKYLICDEMTSMLDALTQASIWRAVLDLAEARNLGLVIISHDQELLARLCDRFLDTFAAAPREAVGAG